jgi:hypothetical protein
MSLWFICEAAWRRRYWRMRRIISWRWRETGVRGRRLRVESGERIEMRIWESFRIMFKIVNKYYDEKGTKTNLVGEGIEPYWPERHDAELVR